MLINLGFEVLTMRNPAQNQDIDYSKIKNWKKEKKNEIFFFWNFFLKFFFLNFFTFRQLILVIRVYTMFIGSPDCDFMKITMGKFIFGLLEKTLFTGVLGVWMTFKKAERPKPLVMGQVWVKWAPSMILRFSRDWHCTSFN